MKKTKKFISTVLSLSMIVGMNVCGSSCLAAENEGFVKRCVNKIGKFVSSFPKLTIASISPLIGYGCYKVYEIRKDAIYSGVKNSPTCKENSDHYYNELNEAVNYRGKLKKNGTYEDEKKNNLPKIVTIDISPRIKSDAYPVMKKSWRKFKPEFDSGEEASWDDENVIAIKEALKKICDQEKLRKNKNYSTLKVVFVTYNYCIYSKYCNLKEILKEYSNNSVIDRIDVEHLRRPNKLEREHYQDCSFKIKKVRWEGDGEYIPKKDPHKKRKEDPWTLFKIQRAIQKDKK